MKRVQVAGAGFKAYEVFIGTGLLADAAIHIAPFLKNRRVLIVTDSNLEKAGHLKHLRDAIGNTVDEVKALVLAPGEDSKSWEGLKSVTDFFVETGLDRKDVVIALGGGVIGDLTGFACAIYMRGIDFIQIPTTLLSQVDSSVGGKTAIDHPKGKNLIGAFHQPRLVLCDLDVLKTLPKREILAGYAEVIKYGLLGDRVFFEWLEANDQAVIALEPEALEHAVARSVEMKAEIVAKDEREGGVRALLNLGHTFGHALEAECGFGDVLVHGEAVAIGMAQAFRFSASEGLIPAEDAQRAVEAIARSGLPTRMSDIRNQPFPARTLIAHMGHDKKAEGGSLTFILAKSIGDTFVAKRVEPERIEAFLVHEGAERP